MIKDCNKKDFPNCCLLVTLINVNFPNCEPDEVVGSVVCRQGKFEHGLMIGERADGRGLPYYWLEFAGKQPDSQPGTDINALQENCIALTPVRMDMTHHGWIDDLNREFDR